MISLPLCLIFAAFPVHASAVSLVDAQAAARDILHGAAVAPEAEAPAVSGRPAPELTALQRHVSFFDKNGDGLIAVSETAQGLRELGLGSVEAGAMAAVLHALLGPATSGRLDFGILLADVHRGKHGSDTGVYDQDGRLVFPAFERMFAEFDANRSGSLCLAELDAMIAANAKVRPGGERASAAEFHLLLRLAADTTETSAGQTVPALSRQRLLEFYDGSLLFKLAKR